MLIILVLGGNRLHKHIVNGYVAKDILKSSLLKVKNERAMVQQFKEGFNLSPSMMKIAVYFELIGSIF